MSNHFIVFLLVFAIGNTEAQMLTDWQEVYPGVWKLTVGHPEKISLLKAAGISAYVEGFNALPGTSFPLDKNDIAIQESDGKIFLRFPLQKEEQIFGLGLQFQSVNHRGQILNLQVDHYDGRDDGRTHAPVPFYVSSAGYGVLIDAARYMTIYVGTGVSTSTKNPPVVYDRNTDANWDAQPYSDAVEILVPAKGLELYVFAGPSPMNVVQRYNLMNGGGYLPPKWGLGFTQRVPTLFSQTDIINEAKAFEAHQFPLDFIGVEPGWHSMAYPCTYEWDKNRFPYPKEFIDSLLSMGIRTNLWLNPYVSPKASIYPALKNLSGSHTVWNGMVPDFTIEDTKNIFKQHFFQYHLNIGVGGYKLDEVDGFDNWLWPDVATFPSGTSAEQMRQVYGLLVQKMTADWFKEKNQRTYGLVRASNAGASALPYVIYDDYYSHKDFITALINSSFIGVLWTPEVRASATAEEWLRRMQTVCFSPMAMINAWADGTKPWSFESVEKSVKEIADLRMQLLPYLYSAFAQYRFEGKPVFRAMQLLEKNDFLDATGHEDKRSDYSINGMLKNDMKDQYMMGDNILVAPLFAGEKTRKVFLPFGKWYDFYTGNFAGENTIIDITPDIDKIPLYVKDGGIIPMIPTQRQAPKADAHLPLTIRYYGTKPGRYILYVDDGLTFNYENGACSFTQITIAKNAAGKRIGTIATPHKDKPFGYTQQVNWVFMTK